MSNRLLNNRFASLIKRFGSTLSKESSLNKNKSANQEKYDSKYLASDMYNYTTFSYYDIESSMTKFRLSQPSAYASLKAEPTPQKK